MNTDRDFHFFLTRLSAAELAILAEARASAGDAMAARVAEGLRIAAQCRALAEARQARSRARRAAWLGLRLQWRRWCDLAARPVGPWAHRVGRRLRQTLSAFGELA